MARFFFDVRDGTSLLDDVGTHCETLSIARHTALRLACDLMHDDPLQFWKRGNCAIDVKDDRRRLLFSLEFTLEEQAATQRITHAA